MKVFVFLLLASYSITCWCDEYEKNYEEAECKTRGVIDGEIVLDCGERPTITKLIVTTARESLSGNSYEADVIVKNTNKYTVRLKSFVVTALSEKNEPLGYCSDSVDSILKTGDVFETKIGCKIVRFTRGGSEPIKKISLKASPWE
jgi:hypothetical protein